METRPEDILCGKEKHCVSHQGSLNFRIVIDQYAAKYADAITKQEKMNVTKEIYDMLGNKNARFLKINNKQSKDKGWEELSSLLARDKISHALRFANREKKATATPKSTSSSPKSKSNKKSHRRTGSDDSNSTLTTVGTELSLDDFENLMLDDGEPLVWDVVDDSTNSSSSSSSEPRPYVYEVPYESAPPAHYHHHHHAPSPYYHPSAYHAPSPYYYPHPQQQQAYHHYPSAAPAAAAPQHHYQQAPAPAPPQAAQVQAMAFPEKPMPAAPVRESTMDVDLTYMMSEPLMDWDLETDEVLLVQ